MELNKIINYGEKFGDVTVILERERTSELIYSNRKVLRFVDGEEVSLGVRISKGRKFGYSSTTDLNNWKEAVLSAAKIMKVSKEMEVNIPLTTPKKTTKVSGVYSPEVSSITPSKLFAFGEELVGAVHNEFNVPNASVSTAIQETSFANSNGVYLTHKESEFSSSIEVSNSKVNAYDFHTSHNMFNPSKVGRSASNLLKSKIGAKKITHFKGDVLFDYFAVSDLMESVIIPAVLASNVQSKRSRFVGKLGEKIFSDAISIYDNGVLAKGLFSSPFDGEGERRQKTTVFEKGVLKNFLYDNFSAKKDGVKSTGDSGGIDILPNVAPTNFVIKKSRISKEDMISEIREGLLVRDLIGTHLINKITGDCSVGVEDVFYVKNGEIKYPVKQAMISFNLFEALSKVRFVGNKHRQEGNVVSPPILFEDVQVIG
ncbi:MAG: TldD/PmbA family protein [Nanoarchaeota archaeon]|nr:TldD/PmbA family protein [Nanoarchaeota archaeon]